MGKRRLGGEESGSHRAPYVYPSIRDLVPIVLSNTLSTLGWSGAGRLIVEKLLFLSQHLRIFLLSRAFMRALICIALGLRLLHYVSNKSFRGDEVSIAWNVLERILPDLLAPLSYNQAAPFGFLFFESVVVKLFGNHALAFRLLPFLSSCISVFLFLSFARRTLHPIAVPIALALFATSDYLIFYASDTKPYSYDVLFSLLLYLSSFYFFFPGKSFFHISLFSFLAGITFWFSFPSVFTFFGISFSTAIAFLYQKRWQVLIYTGVLSMIPITMFAAYYSISLHKSSTNRFLFEYWQSAFMPLPPTSLSDFHWFPSAFLRIFEKPGGLRPSGVAALMFLAGCISLFGRSKLIFLAMITPLLITFLASGFHKYPLGGRLLLFYTPVIFILVSQGLWSLYNNRSKALIYSAIFFLAIIFFNPLKSSMSMIYNLRNDSGIKPTLAFLQMHKRDGDIIYVYYESEHVFRYYANKYDIPEDVYVIGVKSTDSPMGYSKEIEKLSLQQSVWILFPRIRSSQNLYDEQYLINYFENIGTRLCAFKHGESAVYLYSTLAISDRPPCRLGKGGQTPIAIK